MQSARAQAPRATDSLYCQLQGRLEIAATLARDKATRGAWDTLLPMVAAFAGHEEMEFQRLLGEYHFWLGYSAFYLGDTPATKDHLHKADSLVFAIDGLGTELRARIRRMQGSAAYFMDENAFKAQNLYNAAYQEWMKIPVKDSIEYAIVLQCMGQAAGRLGEYDKSVDLYEQSLDIRERFHGSGHWRVGWTYWNLGNTHFYAYQFEKARSAYEQALEILEATTPGDHGTIGNIRNNLAVAYYRLGLLDESIQEHQKAIAIQGNRLGVNDAELAIGLSNLAMVLAVKREFQAAKSALAQASKICAFHHLTSGKQYAQLKLKEAFVENEMAGPSMNVFLLAQHAMLAIAPSTNLADLYSFPEAMETNEPVLMQEIALFKADMMRMASRTATDQVPLLAASLDGYELVGKLSDRLRTQYEDQDDKLALSDKGTKYLQDALLAAHRLWELTGDRRYASSAFQFMERNKFQLLLEFFKRSQVQVAGELLEPEMLSLDSLQSRCAELDFLLSQPKLPLDSQQYYRTELLEKRQHLRVLEDSLQKRSLLYRTVQTTETAISLDAFRQAVGDPSLGTIAFALTDSIVFVMSSRNQDVKFRSTALPIAFKDSVATWLSLCRQVATEPRDFQRFTTLGHDLYNLLLRPELEQFGEEVHRLLIVPDGILGNLPFEALLKDAVPASQHNYGKLPYLIRNYQIHYGASASLWAGQRARQFSDVPMECLGIAWGDESPSQPSGSAQTLPALKGSIEEVEAIQAAIQGRYLVGEAASEAAFKQFASQFGLLHLALHARAEADPQILFPYGGNSSEDGILYFHELFRLHLKSRLAVLSACETAAGKLHNGEGIQSMSSGFAAAGIPSLLVSLWDVDDRSGSAIMKQFYAGIARGLTLDEALREAKLAYLDEATGYEASPFYWSAFVPLGNMQPLILQPASGDYRWSIAVGIALALCILTVFSIYNKKQRAT
jgi:CHAT domain-containing protein/tetratricopeptide (TPR) repeat protein